MSPYYLDNTHIIQTIIAQLLKLLNPVTLDASKFSMFLTYFGDLGEDGMMITWMLKKRV
jgi:hypothetical protein